METKVGEKISVLILFENNQLKPLIFYWQKRVYKILRVVFSYSKNTGREKIFYFSVECQGGFFELLFNRDQNYWEINKILTD